MCKNFYNAEFFIFTCSLLKSNNIKKIKFKFKMFPRHVCEVRRFEIVCCNKCEKTHIETEDSNLLEYYAV